MAPSIFKRAFLYLFHYHFYILIVYHREHVLIFSWHQKRSIYSCWMFGRWLFRWIKKNPKKTMLVCHSLHVLLLISSDLTVLPSESRGRWVGKGKKQQNKKGCCYILSSGQRPRWEPSREGMYSIDPWWDETVTLLDGENKFWYICFQSFFSFLFSFFFCPRSSSALQPYMVKCRLLWPKTRKRGRMQRKRNNLTDRENQGRPEKTDGVSAASQRRKRPKS